MQCQQPTTDICSFFTRALVLCAGEVVYFGETGAQAVKLLGDAGMPCPPLYSPLEQFMRLIDPTFEVGDLHMLLQSCMVHCWTCCVCMQVHACFMLKQLWSSLLGHVR